MHSEPSQTALKQKLRDEMRRARREIMPASRQQLDPAINNHLLQFAEAGAITSVAAFMSFDGEPDILPAMQALADSGAVVALPVIADGAGQASIVFRQWDRKCEMRPNRYGIAEPAGTRELQAAELDLVLVPLVAWDAAGGRLGMGASFYDRYLQPYADADLPLRVGVAYGAQQVAAIPLDPWDVRLHGVLSETGFLDCKDQ
jgi:5-formyltetrahydrofolate cyclo-ligase